MRDVLDRIGSLVLVNDLFKETDDRHNIRGRFAEPSLFLWEPALLGFLVILSLQKATKRLNRKTQLLLSDSQKREPSPPPMSVVRLTRSRDYLND